MFSWIGLSVEDVQHLCVFDACYDKFPGHGDNGHLPPTVQQMEDYWRRGLRERVDEAKKIIVLGAVAKGFLESKFNIYNSDKFLCLIHPSMRNKHRIDSTKDIIRVKLANFLYEYR